MQNLDNLSLTEKVKAINDQIYEIQSGFKAFSAEAKNIKDIFSVIKNAHASAEYSETVELSERVGRDGVYFRAELRVNNRRQIVSERIVSFREFESTGSMKHLVLYSINWNRREIQRHLVLHGISSIIDTSKRIDKQEKVIATEMFREPTNQTLEAKNFREAYNRMAKELAEDRGRQLEALMWGQVDKTVSPNIVPKTPPMFKYNWEGCDLGKAKAEFLPIGKGLLDRLEDKIEDSEELLLIDLDD